jgi:plastocyanin
MRSIVLCAAALGLCACDDNGSTSAPTSVIADLSAVAAPSGDLAAAPGADMATSAFPTSASVTVGAGGALAFTPMSVDIAAGGTVTWNWAADNTMFHNVTSGDTPARFAASPTQMSGSYQVTLTAAGTYFYFCTVHGRNVMNGTVIVH